MDGEANAKLRAAREATPSRRVPGRAMFRTELAELVSAHVWERHGVVTPFDRKYLAKIEQGGVRWPGTHYPPPHPSPTWPAAPAGARCSTPTSTPSTP